MTHIVDRRKFINWLENEQLTDDNKTIRHSLIDGGEYIVTAEELFEAHIEIPVHLIHEYKGTREFEYVEYCTLKLIQ